MACVWIDHYAHLERLLNPGALDGDKMLAVKTAPKGLRAGKSACADWVRTQVQFHLLVCVAR